MCILPLYHAKLQLSHSSAFLIIFRRPNRNTNSRAEILAWQFPAPPLPFIRRCLSVAVSYSSAAVNMGSSWRKQWEIQLFSVSHFSFPLSLMCSFYQGCQESSTGSAAMARCAAGLLQMGPAGLLHGSLGRSGGCVIEFGSTCFADRLGNLGARRIVLESVTASPRRIGPRSGCFADWLVPIGIGIGSSR